MYMQVGEVLESKCRSCRGLLTDYLYHPANVSPTLHFFRYYDVFLLNGNLTFRTKCKSYKTRSLSTVAEFLNLLRTQKNTCFIFLLILQMGKLSPRKWRRHEGSIALNSIMKAGIFRVQLLGWLQAFKSEMNALGWAIVSSSTLNSSISLLWEKRKKQSLSFLGPGFRGYEKGIPWQSATPSTSGSSGFPTCGLPPPKGAGRLLTAHLLVQQGTKQDWVAEQ